MGHLALELRTAGGEPLLVRSFALAAGRAAALRGVVVAIVQALAVEATESRAPTERMIDRFARWYTPAIMVLALLVAAGLSYATEVTQHLLPGRHPSLKDWLMNTLGAAALLAPRRSAP